MSEFTDVRGLRPELTVSRVLVDTRHAVVVEGKGGNVESVIEGDLVVAVLPKGNDGTASIFVNDEKVYAAFPYETEEDQRAFADLCDKVIAEFTEEADAAE